MLYLSVLENCFTERHIDGTYVQSFEYTVKYYCNVSDKCILVNRYFVSFLSLLMLNSTISTQLRVSLHTISDYIKFDEETFNVFLNEVVRLFKSRDYTCQDIPLVSEFLSFENDDSDELLELTFQTIMIKIKRNPYYTDSEKETFYDLIIRCKNKAILYGIK